MCLRRCQEKDDEWWWRFCPWAHCLRLKYDAKEFASRQNAFRCTQNDKSTNYAATTTSFEVDDEDAKNDDSNDLDEIWARRSRI